jgi:hypothetical protein
MSARLVLLAVCLTVGALATAYVAGRSAGAKAVAVEQNTAQLDTNATKLDTAEAQVDTAAQRTATELAVRKALAEERARVRARITVTDGTVTVDSQPPIPVPPEVIEMIGLSDRLIKQDSLTIASLRVQVAALERTNALLRDRVALLETRVDLVKGSRCGMKCGVALGATGTLAVIYALGSLIR